jgi:hypothetical protein
MPHFFVLSGNLFFNFRSEPFLNGPEFYQHLNGSSTTQQKECSIFYSRIFRAGDSDVIPVAYGCRYLFGSVDGSPTVSAVAFWRRRIRPLSGLAARSANAPYLWNGIILPIIMRARYEMPFH